MANPNTYYNGTDGAIAAGTSLSGAIKLNGQHLAGLVIPAGWTTAVVTFQVSADGVTFQPLVDEYGTEISLTVTAGRSSKLPPTLVYGWDSIKLRSGTNASAVNQSSAVTVGAMIHRYG